MLDWRKAFGVRSNIRPEGSVAAAREAHGNAGDYQSLYEYLRDRYANRVVLTFGEIEDLLGFPLPGPASAHPSWWDPAAAFGRRPTQSDAWTLARRTATVNLVARSVAFDREDG